MIKLYVILFLFPLACNAQEGFYLGVNANNGLYWLYNKYDFSLNDSTDLKTVPPDAFKFSNHFVAGLNFGFGISERFGVDTRINYSQFQQNYRRIIGMSNPITFMNFITKLNYTEFQLTGTYCITNPYEHSIIPYFKAGINFSYLLKYIDKEVYPTTYPDISENVNSNGKYYSNWTGSNYYYEGTCDFIYNRFVWGTDFGFGLNIPASDHFQIGIELIAKYDIRNTDNLNANAHLPDTTIKYWHVHKEGYDGPSTERPLSHNIYTGLGITVNYFFRSRYDY